MTACDNPHCNSYDHPEHDMTFDPCPICGNDGDCEWCTPAGSTPPEGPRGAQHTLELIRNLLFGDISDIRLIIDWTKTRAEHISRAARRTKPRD